MNANIPDPAGHSEAWFCTTRWSVVLSARDADSPRTREALETLCRTYWPPLYAYVRRLGHSPHDAEDLTQAFFAKLLEKDYVAAARQDKGRFRTFLLIALKRFLANEWDREHAQKRGGFRLVLSIDQEEAESRLLGQLAHGVTPEVVYERHWALTLLEHVTARLREEYLATGRAKLFEHLRNCLARDETALPYAQFAAELNLTEAAVKMAAQRLRARYRELLRLEIAETVSAPEEIDEEIGHLFSTFET